MITKTQRNLEMKNLENKVSKFNEVSKIYRGQQEVPKNKTWVQICNEYEILLKSYIRYDYLKQCAYKTK
tara:strand:+ start:216 stop:422 length:207 start_codon:yes stop_codon:yes gene_type:complete